MVGKHHQNAQKVKAKSTKELSEEAESLKDDNEMLKKQVNELHVIIKIMREELNAGKTVMKGTENPNVKEFECNKCDETFVSSTTLKEHVQRNHPRNITCKTCRNLSTLS